MNQNQLFITTAHRDAAIDYLDSLNQEDFDRIQKLHGIRFNRGQKANTSLSFSDLKIIKLAIQNIQNGFLFDIFKIPEDINDEEIPNTITEIERRSIKTVNDIITKSEYQLIQEIGYTKDNRKIHAQANVVGQIVEMKKIYSIMDQNQLQAKIKEILEQNIEQKFNSKDFWKGEEWSLILFQGKETGQLLVYRIFEDILSQQIKELAKNGTNPETIIVNGFLLLKEMPPNIFSYNSRHHLQIIERLYTKMADIVEPSEEIVKSACRKLSKYESLTKDDLEIVVDSLQKFTGKIDKNTTKTIKTHYVNLDGTQLDGTAFYEGDLRNGLPYGYGKITHSDGTVVEGTFNKEGKLEGKGTIAFGDGCRFEGFFNTGGGRHYHIGIMSYADGSRNEGFFNYDLFPKKKVKETLTQLIKKTPEHAGQYYNLNFKSIDNTFTPPNIQEVARKTGKDKDSGTPIDQNDQKSTKKIGN